MKKILISIIFIIVSIIGYSQIPIEFGIHARGSDINGILGAEFQILNFSISESWRPMTKGVNSSVTTLSIYFKKRYYDSSPYIRFGYSTKGYPKSKFDFNTYSYDLTCVDFYPAGFMMIGFKTIVSEISDRLSGQGGIGFTFSEYGHFFSFELSINYILFKNS